MTDEDRRILDAAVAYIIWENKVPLPPDANAESERLRDELHNAVSALFTNDEWWALTYAPNGWPEPVK